MNEKFTLKSVFKPAGSQPEAIKQLNEGISKSYNFQTLLGVTGSGKTFSMAHVIASYNKPTLVLAPNKTLAAQLYNEFRDFFPDNRVEYFVSYYDYYQPESYIPSKDQYIEKDSAINKRIEMMRLASTASLAQRSDVIIVASVSCIYGAGNPENYKNMGFEVKTKETIGRKELLRKLVSILYERNDLELLPGRFRVKGDTIDFIPAYSENIIRVEMFGEEIEKISEIEKTSGKIVENLDYFYVYPAKLFVTPESETERAIASIMQELDERLPELEMIEAHRLKQRTLFDIEMIKETGSCKGIENYSRHFDNRKPGEKPFCLLDYFPRDFLIIIDESHQTIPQLHGMYKGDKSRKKALIDYGFRLPSAYDNRPLKFEEIETFFRKNRTIFVSATPGDYELKNSSRVVEQIIRPTGLVDPVVEVRPIKNQMKNILGEINSAVKNGNRVLITTLTKKLAEELADYLSEQGVKTRYLHSEIKTLERTEIIRELRLGVFDVLVGINLLREGLDIPEVGFIGILDADKEGFLRNKRSLIQIIGRAARNIDAHVVLYADRITDSIREALKETNRRREIQIEFNRKNKITPKQIVKPIKEKVVEIRDTKHIPKAEVPNIIIELDAEMREAAEMLDFERAIQLREKIKKISLKLTNS